MLGSYATPLVTHIVRGCGIMKTIASLAHRDTDGHDDTDPSLRRGLNAVVGTDAGAQRLAAVCVAYTRDLLRATKAPMPSQPASKRAKLEEQDEDTDGQAVVSGIAPDQLLRACISVLGVLKSLAAEAGW